ncbi:LysR family transcriptional regulator [Ruegeria sp. EL01]|uniref:LysR family transcriptional regulator n=1 Tax=Ruegeria sp. EL01 TaxID=2107578 RepID=UPI000EA80E47|nr:LysR family transcriptional regulator [Ruegeria sp. EL01]
MAKSIAQTATLMENLHLLHRFLATAEAGSITEAARQIGLTPSSLTRSIKALEENLSLRLFDRHPLGVSLTPSGKLLLSHTKAVERELHYASAELNAFSGGQRGTIRVGAMPFWAHQVLPPVIAKLQRKFTGFRAELAVGTGYSIYARLIDGELDVATISSKAVGDVPPFIGTLHGPDVVIVAAASTDHPIHSDPNLSPTQLLKYPWAMYGEDRENLAAINSQMNDIAGGTPDIAVVSASLEAIIQTVSYGPYITWIAEPLLAIGRANPLSPIKNVGPLLHYETRVLYRKSLMNVSPFKFFLDRLKAEFEN